MILSSMNAVRGLVLAVAVGFVPSAVQAQSMVPATPSVAATVWAGIENLKTPDGKLAFGFRANGEVVMVDEVSPGPVQGNWSQNGDQVVIRFRNCIYRGRIVNGLLTGTAQFTQGQLVAWAFQMQMVQNVPQTAQR